MSSSRKESPAEQEAKAWGIDLSLIESNLARTPTERLEVLQQALTTILELRRAWHHDQSEGTPSKIAGKRD